MTSNYHKGRRREYRVQAILERAGYMTTRAASSKGPADVIAWNGQTIRFISVKSGGAYASSLERERLEGLPVPPNASKEIWRLPTGCREPLIEVL
jgi:Holliday junction resolvase